jgi:cell division protein FtsW
MLRLNGTHHRLPTTILIAGFLVACFGLLAIYDASVVDAFRTFGDKFHYVKQQAIWIVIGVIVATITANIPIGLLKKYAHVLYGFTLFLMVIVLIPGIGSKFLGARRWIDIGFTVIQPAELLKITLAIYLANWLEQERSLKHFLILLGINLILIMLQPDLGTAIITVGVSFMIYYLSGAKIKEIFSFAAILGVAISALIVFSPYRMERMKTFIDPTNDPLGASYHINQVLY